jgi:hypothetical protein
VKSSAHECIEVQTLKGVGHHQGWTEHWPQIIKKPLPCSKVLSTMSPLPATTS